MYFKIHSFINFRIVNYLFIFVNGAGLNLRMLSYILCLCVVFCVLFCAFRVSRVFLCRVLCCVVVRVFLCALGFVSCVVFIVFCGLFLPF